MRLDDDKRRHEFNNQLGIIRGFTEVLLADAGADSPHRDDLAVIHAAAVRALDLLGYVDPLNGQCISALDSARESAEPSKSWTEFEREHFRRLAGTLPEYPANLRTANARLRSPVSPGLEVASEREADGRLQEAHMPLAFQTANVGIWDMEMATGAVRWSETLEAQYGLRPGTFGGTFKAFADCIHPDDRFSTMAAIEKAIKDGTEFSVLSRSIMPDGTVRWLSGGGVFSSMTSASRCAALAFLWT